MTTARMPLPRTLKILFQVVALLVVFNQFSLTTKKPNQPEETINLWRGIVAPYPSERINDFFQEWASARNWHTGLPIYEHHVVTIPLYLELAIAPDQVFFPYNAHPPTSVVMALPLGAFDFRTALLLWHGLTVLAFGISVWLIGREWQVWQTWAWLWWVLPVLALLMLMEAWQEQWAQGQLNGVLMVLLVGAWVAERRGWTALAGVCLGVAMCIKIFPAFLFFYFLLQKRYRALVAGGGTVLVLSGATALVLGPTVYVDYLTTVLPSLGKFRPSRFNHSIVGFWHRLFVPNHYDYTVPLWPSAAAAWVGTFLTAVPVIFMVGVAVWRARTRAAQDRAFWLTTTGMVLLGPLTWPHSHLLLSVAAILLVIDLTRFGRPGSGTFVVALLLLLGECFPLHDQLRDYLPAVDPQTPMGPLHSVLVSSLPFYGLVVFFVWQWLNLRRLHRPTTG